MTQLLSQRPYYHYVTLLIVQGQEGPGKTPEMALWLVRGRSVVVGQLVLHTWQRALAGA